MKIRLAKEDEFDAVMDFYYQMTEDLETSDHGPGWEKDVYPTRQSVKDAINAENLFLIKDNDTIAATMILNHDYTDGYEAGGWAIDADPSDLLFVHALGVGFQYQGQGLGKQLVDFIIEYGREHNLKAVQLDVLWNNASAKQLYLTKGFNHVGTIELFYEDTGLTDYDLYEFIL